MAAEVESERELNRAKDELIAGLSHELRTPFALGTVMATLLIVGFSRLELPRPAQNPFERIRANRG